MIAIGQESKELIQSFQSSIKFVNSLETEKAIKYLGYKKFQHVLPADMSAKWKLLNVGEAAKQHSKFCHCCSIDSMKIHYSIVEKCEWSKEMHADENWKCYHHSMMDKDKLKVFTDELNIVLEAFNKSIEFIEQKSSIKLMINDLTAETDIFLLISSRQKQFSALIDEDLKL